MLISSLPPLLPHSRMKRKRQKDLHIPKDHQAGVNLKLRKKVIYVKDNFVLCLALP